MGDCKPLGFLIGLPFALVACVWFPAGAVFWAMGTVLSCLFPCCGLFSKLAKRGGNIVKLPVKIMEWFMDKSPC